MNLKLAHVSYFVGILAIVLGLVAVVTTAARGGGLLSPGWIVVAIGLAEIAVTRATARSARQGSRGAAS